MGFRSKKRVVYSALTADTPYNRPPANQLSVNLRQSVNVVFKEKESPLGRCFEVEWSRVNDTPFDFITRGLELMIVSRGTYAPEYVAPESDDIPDFQIYDAGQGAEDQSAFPVWDGGAGAIDPYDYPVIINGQLQPAP